MFQLGFNTNGLAHHRLDEALTLVADLGYQALALTPDVGHLDPFRSSPAERRTVRNQARDLGLALVIETGARFLLDPRKKHFPTLLEDEATDRTRRLQFLLRCADLAVDLGAPLVSIWSGAAPTGITSETDSDESERCWERLTRGIEELLGEFGSRGIALAFEPEPGMFIERPAGFFELRERLGACGDGLGLTLDLGHLLCTEEGPPESAILQAGPCLANVHLDDIRDGVHRHRLFGEGDIDLKSALKALVETGYSGVASVELSRDSHRGAWVAAEAMKRIRQALGSSS
ncbi:MAG: sugar phosphate isomerase/epimerase family protein [bacterium]|nr:sugar phosphate isomerase/epimerase [Planctomycetota bacterium]HIL52476.1 sugar phosphate isomerase/epimerase [Planctomycetota bacterium]